MGAGAKMADVDAETALHGMVTPLGSYSELGVAGFTLLGGTGFLTRAYGCTADNALEFGKTLFVSQLNQSLSKSKSCSFVRLFVRWLGGWFVHSFKKKSLQLKLLTTDI